MLYGYVFRVIYILNKFNKFIGIDFSPFPPGLLRDKKYFFPINERGVQPGENGCVMYV